MSADNLMLIKSLLRISLDRPGWSRQQFIRQRQARYIAAKAHKLNPMEIYELMEFVVRKDVLSLMQRLDYLQTKKAVL